jgi:pimeloyl-ACP methyl ester carboxylesterase
MRCFVRIALVFLLSMLAPAPAAHAEKLTISTEEGYRVEEGFLRVTIKDRLTLLQSLIVKKADAIGKLPIIIMTHGTNSSANERQAMTPRGTTDGNLRLLRAYAQRGWLAVYILRRGYGESDGPIPILATKCDGSSPTVQEFMDADANDLEAALASIGRRVDADTSRIMALGVSGGGLAVIALGARNIRGLKIVVNISGGLRTTGCSDVQNSERLVAAARHYGTKSRVPNVWYYAEEDLYAPGPTAAQMRSAFLEGGGYAKLTHYGKIIDFVTGKEVGGHLLWSKQRAQIMVDIDNYLRSNGLPTRDANEAKRLAENINASANSVETYLAAPDYKALAQSTTKSTGLAYFYGAATLELAKDGAITACKKYNPGHTCKLIDPPESALTSPAPARDANKSDGLDTTTSMEVRPNEEISSDLGQ